MSTLNAHDARLSCASWVRKQLQSKFEISKYFQITIVFTNCISTDGFLLTYIPNGHRPWTKSWIVFVLHHPSLVLIYNSTKITHGEGFELKCSKTMCTLFKLYNVIITTHSVTVIACARQQIISARSGDTHKQTNKQTKIFSRTSMWGHIEELRM